MKAKPGRYGIETWLALAQFHPAYRKTLTNLRKDCAIVVATDGAALHFTKYPFEPSSIFPTGTIKPERIAEVNFGWPSQVRLTDGEILFVPQAYKEALVKFVNRNDVTTQHRSSIWSSLLEPFLDTWEEQEYIDRQFDGFEKNGLDRKAVNTWRREVAVAMVAYNFGTYLWEWGSFSFYDVLVAQRARLSQTAFADFYFRAMRLAEADSPNVLWNPSTSGNIEGLLSWVLGEWFPKETGGSSKDFSERWKVRREKVERRKQELLAELTGAYTESHRRYHTLAHIENCLLELGTVGDFTVQLDEVRWALLFHDAIYDPRRQDNEVRSADWACRVMAELGRPEEEMARVRGMILATAHSCEPHTADEALLLDIDLSILGADAATFDEYDRCIRIEYHWVPEQQYRQARAAILESFLNRDRLYHTAPYRQRCEAFARANLQRALMRLRSG